MNQSNLDTSEIVEESQLLTMITNSNESKKSELNICQVPTTRTPSSYSTFLQKSSILEFAACFLGLQVSFLVWGTMQELIMSSTYTPTSLNPSGKFPSAIFCVFANRIVAVIVAAIICYFQNGSVETGVPLWYFTPCALSNTISSWSSYLSLKFVHFTVQTIFKSTKVSNARHS